MSVKKFDLAIGVVVGLLVAVVMGTAALWATPHPAQALLNIDPGENPFDTMSVTGAAFQAAGMADDFSRSRDIRAASGMGNWSRTEKVVALAMAYLNARKMGNTPQWNHVGQLAQQMARTEGWDAPATQTTLSDLMALCRKGSHPELCETGLTEFTLFLGISPSWATKGR